MINAKVIADSKNEFGNRITTMVVTFPRIILAEFNTHRMFSRNSASSRAIPFEKMVKSVKENPFIPIAWQADHKGMQGTEYIHNNTGGGGDESRIQVGWNNAVENAIREATWMNDYGLTKQICNRLLEPFMWHTVIVTATEWENFFALRCPQYFSEGYYEGTFRSKKDLRKAWSGKGNFPPNDNIIDWLKINKGQAEIHMMALAEAMWDAYNESIPKQLKAGEWHIPFGDNINFGEDGYTAFDHENNKILNNKRIKIATARCARVSYTVIGEEGKPDNYENDIKLHDRLAASGHWSPFEHCAKSMNYEEFGKTGIVTEKEWNHGWSGNFRGFKQYRKMFEKENITK